MEKNLNLKKPDMQEISKVNLRLLNGGTTCPTYDIKDNSDGLVYSGEIAGPIILEVAKFFLRDFMKAIFL